MPRTKLRNLVPKVKVVRYPSLSTNTTKAMTHETYQCTTRPSLTRAFADLSLDCSTMECCTPVCGPIETWEQYWYFVVIVMAALSGVLCSLKAFSLHGVGHLLSLRMAVLPLHCPHSFTFAAFAQSFGDPLHLGNMSRSFGPCIFFWAPPSPVCPVEDSICSPLDVGIGQIRPTSELNRNLFCEYNFTRALSYPQPERTASPVQGAKNLSWSWLFIPLGYVICA